MARNHRARPQPWSAASSHMVDAAEPVPVLREVDSFTPEHRDMVLRGAAIALASMALDNPAVLRHIEAASRAGWERCIDALSTQ
jgi:hypothetical protein